MELPYDREVYTTLIGGYNRDYLVFVVTGAAICFAGTAVAAMPSVARHIAVKRLIMAGLALCSLFVGGVHQMILMASLNFTAPVYGGLWIAQGLLLLWLAASGRASDLFDAPPARQLAGLAIAVYGLVLHPALVQIVSGDGFLTAAFPGTTPDATALVIAGLVLTMRNPPLVALVVPLVWAGIAGFTAYLLSFPLGFAVPAGLGLMVAYSLYARFLR
ncbi:MAG: DUF6064 family protein [Alphaproteobacteria bacterium]